MWVLCVWRAPVVSGKHKKSKDKSYDSTDCPFKNNIMLRGHPNERPRARPVSRRTSDTKRKSTERKSKQNKNLEERDEESVSID